MYLRYREPVWDSAESTDGASSRRPATGPGGRRRRASLAGSGRSSARITDSSKTLPVIELHGVKLHAVTESQVINHILDALDEGQGGVVVTPNLDHLRRYCRDLSFGALI